MICSLRVVFAIGKPGITVAKTTANSQFSPSTSATLQPCTSALSVSGTGGVHDWTLGQLLFLMDGLNAGAVWPRCNPQPLSRYARRVNRVDYGEPDRPETTISYRAWINLA